MEVKKRNSYGVDSRRTPFSQFSRSKRICKTYLNESLCRALPVFLAFIPVSLWLFHEVSPHKNRSVTLCQCEWDKMKTK